MAALQIDPTAVAKARESGYSDTEIANHLAEKMPEQFKGARDAGYSDAEILQHFAPTPQAPSGVIAGLQHGLAGAVGGDASTAGLTGAPTGPLDAAAATLEPKNYKSAPLIREGGHWYNPMDYQPSSIPQLAAEAAPGMAQDMGAAKLASTYMPGNPALKAAAGLAGYGGSMLLRTFGPGAHAKADARTGVPNSPVEGGDMLREGASQAATLPLNMLGGKLLGPNAGGVVAGGAASKLIKTLGLEYGIGGTTDVIDQAATTAGSKDGFNIDGNRAATSAAARAIGSTLMAAPGAAREANNNRKYSGYEATPETKAAAEAVATRVKDATDNKALVGPLGGTATAADGVVGARNNIHRELAAATKNEALSQDNENTLAAINRGDNVTPKAVAALQGEASPETMHLAHQAIIIKNEIARGNLTEPTATSDGKFTGGLGGAMENLPIIRTPIKAALTTGGAAALGALGVPGVGHAVGAVAVPAAAAVAGAYGGARMIDRLTGSRSPIQPFVDRFGDANAPARMQPAAPPVQPPATTSVPQSAPPQNTQLWGAPAAPVAPQQSLKAMLNNNVQLHTGISAIVKQVAAASARQNALAAAQAPAPEPQPQLPWSAPKVGELYNGPNPTALKMLNAKLKQGLPPDPVAPAPPVEAPPEQPTFNPTALSMLQKKLKMGLPPEPVAPAAPAPTVAVGPPPAQAPAPVAPAEPTAQAAPTIPMLPKKRTTILPAGFAASLPSMQPPAPPVEAPQAAPQMAPPAPAGPTSIGSVLSRVTAQIEAQKAQNPAATPPGGVTTQAAPPAAPAPAPGPVVPPEPAPPAVLPTPPVNTLKKLKGSGVIKERTGPAEYMDPDTGEMLSHTPLTKEQLWGRNMTHDQFAARETSDKLGSGELEKDKAESYHTQIVVDRKLREHEMQVASQHEAGPDDVPLAKLLLQELHHQRYGNDARSAAKFYSAHMSPPMRAAVAKLMDGPFKDMWSKDSKEVYATKTSRKYKSGSSTNEHTPTSSILHKLKLMEAAE